MLCHFCQNLVFVPAEELDAQDAAAWSTRPESKYYMRELRLISVHQPSRKALEISAICGCRVCALIWFQLFQDTMSAETHRDNDHGVSPIILSTGGEKLQTLGQMPYAMTLYCGERSGSLIIDRPLPGKSSKRVPYTKLTYDADDLSTMLELSCVLSTRSEQQSTPIGSAVDADTGSIHNMSLIKTWIQDCQKTHCLCSMEISSQRLPLLPTRVIEIETDGQARVTETMGMRAEYLTLSYCWGQGKKLLSTKGSDSYEQFKQRLPVDDTMPRTFRDALQVTSALGFRYLWIDALCIIHDDPEDVGKEMAKMGGIYQQSTLTIFAASGPDTDSGLFSKRDARGSKPCNVRITLRSGAKCLHQRISIRPQIQDYRSTLETRGWVLQEEVLSGRSLTFAYNTVEWSCLTTQAFETYPTVEMHDSFDDQKESSKDLCRRINQAMRLLVRRPDILNEIPSPWDGKRHNHFDRWYDVVAAYSGRALTVDSDKLLAVAGLATLMQENYDLTYVTGLWKEDLQVGLCWWVTSRNNMFRRSGPRSIDEDFPDYIAPTWSWASAHGMCVRFLKPLIHHRLVEEGIQVVDVEVSHVPGALATFGYIRFAKLSICTKLRRVFLATTRKHTRGNAKLEARMKALEDRLDTEEGIVDHEEPRSLSACVFGTHKRSFVGYVSLDSVKLHEIISKQYAAARQVRKLDFAPKLSSDGYKAWCVPCLVQKDDEGNRQMFVLVLT